MIKLICPECRRENEPERIYCHDCGTRLDRSALAKIPPTEEEASDAHKRLKSMFDPQRARIRQLFFTFSKLLLGAAATAALVLILLPPDLPPPNKSLVSLAQVSMDLENASMSHGHAPLQYTEEQVNAYLGYTLKNKKAALSKYVDFERALVRFDEDFLGLTVQRSLYGYSLYTGAAYGVTLQDGKLTAMCKSGSIGRLPIHPKLMQLGGILFADLSAAFERERKSIAKMSGLEFHPQLVVITAKS